MVTLVNRAKMSTSTTGTGTITLGSAESGYQSFADAGVSDGDVVRYVIEDGDDWEIGSGTYTATGTTLSRTVDESSNSDAALNLTGSAVVFITAAAEDIPSPTLTIDDKTGAYTVVAGDLGKIINCTGGSFTVSLTAAATLGAGFYFYVIYTGSGTGGVTIDPAGSEKINVAYNTYKVNARSAVKVFTDGSNWFVLDTSHVGISQLNTTFSGALPAATASSATAIGYLSGGAAGAQAAGSGAMALGGSYASGTDSLAAAIANNTSSYGATGANSVAIGYQAKATQTGGIAIGYNAKSLNSQNLALGFNVQANNNGCFAIGSNTTSQGNSSFSIGSLNYSAENNSFALGTHAYTNVRSKFAYSAGSFFTSGDAQTGIFVLRSDTTDATPEALTTNKSTASTNNQIVLPNNSAYAFHGTIIARQQASAGTACAAWKVEGLIRREGSAGTTVLVNSATTVLDNTPAWGMALSADTTNGGLKIEVTGAASTNIRWVATIHTSEVTYA